MPHGGSGLVLDYINAKHLELDELLSLLKLREAQQKKEYEALKNASK